MSQDNPGWTLLSNHTHVLVCIAKDPLMRLRDVASAVGITERAVQRIVMELEAADIITRERVGRRNEYQIHADQPLRHPLEQHYTIGELVKAVTGKKIG